MVQGKVRAMGTEKAQEKEELKGIYVRTTHGYHVATFKRRLSKFFAYLKDQKSGREMGQETVGLFSG